MGKSSESRLGAPRHHLLMTAEEATILMSHEGTWRKVAGTGTNPCLKSELHKRELVFTEHLPVMDSTLAAVPLITSVTPLLWPV